MGFLRDVWVSEVPAQLGCVEQVPDNADANYPAAADEQVAGAVGAGFYVMRSPPQAVSVRTVKWR